jgi:FHA domain
MTSSVFDLPAGNRQVRLDPAMLQALFAKRQSRDSFDAYLIVRDGRRWGDMHPLRAGMTVPVGRVAVDGIVLNDDRCSRVHCEFYLQGTQWYVRDLGSRNGTRLNGERIRLAVPIEQGDIVRIGQTELLFTQDLDSLGSLDSDDWMRDE